MAAPGEKEIRDFAFRPLQKPEELRSVEEVAVAAYGPHDEPPVPGPIQRAFQDNGGLVLGALADIHLAGVTLGFLGWDGETLYHYSALTAVRPEYQNHRLGFRLKLYERDELLKRGIGLVRWAFDPLSSRAAWLSVRRLGAEIDRYFVHYFGQLGPTEAPTESDRVRASWTIQGPEVEERLSRKPVPTEAVAKRVAAAVPVLETDQGESGLRIPSAVAEPSAPEATLEIPFDLAAIREHERPSLRSWRHAVRDGFRASLDAGYRVDDFAVVTADHERRAFYLLRKRPAPPPPAPSPAPAPSRSA